jgi:hypothetical protein
MTPTASTRCLTARARNWEVLANCWPASRLSRQTTLMTALEIARDTPVHEPIESSPIQRSVTAGARTWEKEIGVSLCPGPTRPMNGAFHLARVLHGHGQWIHGLAGEGSPADREVIFKPPLDNSMRCRRRLTHGLKQTSTAARPL